MPVYDHDTTLHTCVGEDVLVGTNCDSVERKLQSKLGNLASD